MRAGLIAFGSLLLATASLARTQSGNPEPILRFDVNLVQVDAVVTDHNGRHVATLQPEDFEVLQDGKPQKITHFEYVSSATQPRSPDTTRQTIVVLVDDTNVEFADFSYEQKALLRYVDNELQPGVMLSIVRTSGGSTLIRQFSSDPDFLHLAIQRMVWTPYGPWMPAVFALDWVKATIRALAGYPGRKSVLWIGPGIPVDDRGPLWEAIREAADLANRAAVTIQAIDVRALPAFLPGSSVQDASQANPPVINPLIPPGYAYFQRQSVPAQMADFTGGLFQHESNDMLGQVRAAITDADNYYLIGWYPGSDAFKQQPGRPLAYHKIQIRLRPKGLVVRSRDGFYAEPGEAAGPLGHYDPQRQLDEALFSPFRSSAINTRLTSVFDDSQAGAPSIRSLLQIGPEGLDFLPNASRPDCSTSRFELTVAPVLLTWTRNEQVLHQRQRSAIELCGDARSQALRNGIVAEIFTPVQVAGPYQMRAAVRNLGAEENAGLIEKTGLVRRESMTPPQTSIGSATQLVDVPDIQQDKLAISAFSLRSAAARPEKNVTEINRDNPVRTRLATSQGDPAIRSFRPGESLIYGFHVAAGSNAFQARMHLLYNGKEIDRAGPLLPDSTGAFSGTYSLSPSSPSGNYLFGIELTEPTNNDKGGNHMEWLSFSVAPNPVATERKAK